MKHLRILDVLKSGEKTLEDISRETGIPVMETRRFLLRLSEQGKIESFEKDDVIYWRLRKKDEKEEEFKYRY
ncbi:ArsR family transcriptional regulator [Thermococcus atlanticus]